MSMKWIYVFVIVSMCFFVFSSSRWIWSVNQARRKGLYPNKGKPTMFDVRRLIQAGHKDLAIRLYCQIFSTHFKEAKKAIEELERSIQTKNP